MSAAASFWLSLAASRHSFICILFSPLNILCIQYKSMNCVVSTTIRVFFEIFTFNSLCIMIYEEVKQ